jgi:hypothetical protein
MKLLKQDGPHCLIYAATMVLQHYGCKLTPVDLINEIGHDGCTVLWPTRPIPYCYRGVHPQEIQDCFIRRGLGLMNIAPMPVIGNGTENWAIYAGVPEESVTARYKQYMMGNNGIILGQGPHNVDVAHAVAWDGNQCFDPEGFTYPLDDFVAREAFLVCGAPVIKIKSIFAKGTNQKT